MHDKLRSPVRRWVWLCVAAVLVLALGSGSIGAAAVPPVPTVHGRIVTASAGHGDPQYASAVRRVALAVARLPGLPGAQRATRAPIPVLAYAIGSDEPGPHTVNRVTWWVATTPFADALRFFTTHIPTGFTPGEGGSRRQGKVGLPTFQFVGYRGTTAPTRDLTAVFTVAPAPGGVAVREEVTTEWSPTRTADGLVPRPSAGDVWVVRPGRALAVYRVLGAGAAARLATFIDGRPFDEGGSLSCPAWGFGYVDALRFITPRGVYIAHFDVGGCASLLLSAPSGRVYSLDWGTLDPMILRLLGLHWPYG